MPKFYEVNVLPEGGPVKINEDHIVAVKQRKAGGYRVWLSTEIEVGDEPDRLLVLGGNAGPKSVKVLNVQSTDLDELFPAASAT
jgi:hypothetical protein